MTLEDQIRKIISEIKLEEKSGIYTNPNHGSSNGELVVINQYYDNRRHCYTPNKIEAIEGAVSTLLNPIINKILNEKEA